MCHWMLWAPHFGKYLINYSAVTERYRMLLVTHITHGWVWNPQLPKTHQLDKMAALFLKANVQVHEPNLCRVSVRLPCRSIRADESPVLWNVSLRFLHAGLTFLFLLNIMSVFPRTRLWIVGSLQCGQVLITYALALSRRQCSG